MAKRTKKVGIVRKYGCRYGGSLRKVAKKFEVSKHAKYVCPFTGKPTVKRVAAGIWKSHSKAVKNLKIAGGAWELTTPAAIVAKSTMNRLKKIREEQ
mmetsp:Transcript_91759/g.127410  ORF Transcript_91759/g.127410 Transcript_91759/m.127410 type:complete len:97 (+) Transcript_91759:49-339(+)